MLWLFNNENYFELKQIFINNNIVLDIDDNKIFSFDSLTESDFKIKIDLDKYEKIYIDYDIRIIDEFISYIDLKTNKINVYSFKMNFIEPLDNNYNLPIFNFIYKKVNKNKMPNLIESSYDLNIQLNFLIYKISDKIQFVVETNKKTNCEKKYFVTTDLKLIDNFILN